MTAVYGAIEGGGTKFVVLLGSGPDQILERAVIPTTTPSATLAACLSFLRGAQARHRVAMAALGVACFGPVDLDERSSTYGYVTTTPKVGWTFADVVGPLRAGIGVPVGWELDVTGALLGERRWGAAQGLDPVLYVTVGTGVGAGIFVNGAPLHGLLHPEAGHLLMPTLPGDHFSGACPFHGRCLEGLVSGPALARRTGQRAEEIAHDDPLWTHVAEYLAIALMDYTLVLSPRRIVLGGGVLHQRQLLPLIHTFLKRRLADYLPHPLLLQRLEDYVVPSALGDDAGILGALELAHAAAAKADTGGR